MVSSNGNVLDGVAIKHGILLSPLLLVLTLIPLTMLLKGENIGYKLGKYQELINYLMFVDDLKLYGRSEEEQETLINFVQVLDIRMDFELDKCAVQMLKQGVKNCVACWSGDR